MDKRQHNPIFAASVKQHNHYNIQRVNDTTS